jgi:hypothetical protein
LTNGLLLQKETVLQIKQDLIELTYDNLYAERKQANYSIFLKKMGKITFKRAKTKCYANKFRDDFVWRSFFNGNRK